ncbi:hypothetical protein ES708_17756 [subsurface metagenome]
MIEKIKTILRNKLELIALIPMLGSILIIISLFTPFAISKGEEGISISSQSNVWYWGIYQEQDQIFSLTTPFMLNIVLSMIILLFAISIFILSIAFGLNKLKRKFYGELIFIFIVFIFLSMMLTIKLIDYAFSLMPDLEPFHGRHHPFWSYRLEGFGIFGIYVAIFLVVGGSIISLIESKNSFFYLEIITFLIWIIISFLFANFYDMR